MTCHVAVFFYSDIFWQILTRGDTFRRNSRFSLVRRIEVLKFERVDV